MDYRQIETERYHYIDIKNASGTVLRIKRSKAYDKGFRPINH